MSHMLRMGSQCVGEETRVLVRRVGSSKNVSELITKIQCVFTEKPHPTDKDRHYYPINEHYEGDKVVNLTGGESLPLFKYVYDFKGKRETLYKITVKPPKALRANGLATLTATEWHPVMKNKKEVTVASLLAVDDDVLIKVGNKTGVGKVIKVDRVKQTRVVGLALGKVGADLKRVKRLLEKGEAYWNDFGLDVLENIIFVAAKDITTSTASIASGTLAFQYQLRRVIRQGIVLEQIRKIEKVIAKEHHSGHKHEH